MMAPPAPAISAAEPLLSPPVFDAPIASTSRGPLHPGACWEGMQRSGRNVYKVKVDISTVDLVEGTLSGMLQIRHLTPELESLVTFFEGEIIGDRAGFLTGRWGASETDDMKHWSRFPAFSKALRQSLLKPNLTFKQHSNRRFLFMRWKEQFVVPSSHAQNIHGASFAGFYYLCLDFDVPPNSLSAQGEAGRTMSPPPRGAARARSMSSEMPRSMPTPIRSPSSSSAPYETVFEDDLTSNADAHADARAGSSASPIVPPPPPRRASSSGFSYAAAVRGLSPPSQTIDLPIVPLPTPPLIEVSMPKEVDSGELASNPMSRSSSTDSSATTTTATTSTPVSPQLQTVSLPIRIPTPMGTTQEDFPAPSSPPLSSASFGSPPMRGGRSFLTSSPPTSTRSGRVRNTIDAVMLGSGGETMGRERSRSFGGSRCNDKRSSSGQPPSERYDKEPSWGHQSWMNCEIKGFYFFRHSEPYQELSLRYVPKTRGSTQAFAFR